MKFSIRYSDQIVGFFVVLALALLIFVIFMLGTSQRWFKRDHQYVTYFTSAQGLSHNMAIKFKGFTIGNVKKISLSQDNRVEVLFVIHEEYTSKVTEGSLVEVQISPIGLGNNFIFHPGRGRDIIPEGEEIYEVSSEAGRRQIRMELSTRTETTDSIANIMGQVQTLLETLNVSLIGSPTEENTAIWHIINNIEEATSGIADIAVTLSGQIPSVMRNLDDITKAVASPSGTVMSILDAEGPFYSSLEDAIVSLAGIIDSLEKTAAFIPMQLPQIGVLVSQLNVTLNSVQDVLTAILNNPLLRGGVPERKETAPGGSSPRNMNF